MPVTAAGVVLDEHDAAQAPQHLRSLRAVGRRTRQHDGDRPGTVLAPTEANSRSADGRHQWSGGRLERTSRPSPPTSRWAPGGPTYTTPSSSRMPRAACARASAVRSARISAQMAALVGREMLQDQDRRGQGRGQRSEHLGERGQAAGRGGDRDHPCRGPGRREATAFTGTRFARRRRLGLSASWGSAYAPRARAPGP